MRKNSSLTFTDFFVYNFYNIRIKNWRAYMGLAILPILKIIEWPMFLGHIWDIIILVISMSIYLAFAFGINNYYDREEDIEEGDAKKNPIVFGKLSPKAALSFLAFITITGIILVYAYTYDLIVWSLYVSLIFFAWIYSAYPIRLKTRAIWDILSHGLYFGSIIFAYSYLFLFRNKLDALLYNPLLYLIFFYSISLEMRNEVEDFEFDKAAGLKTTAITLGKNNAVKFIFTVLFLHWIIPPLFAYFYIQNAIIVLGFTVASCIVLGLAVIMDNFKWYRVNDILVIFYFILLLF